MNMRFVRSNTLWMSLSVCLLAGAAWADQVVLKNGDRVTGSIIKKDGQSLTIKTDHFGVVTTTWDQVESVRSEKPLNVVLANGRTVQGTISPANGQLQVATGSGPVSVAPAEITAIRNQEEQQAYERLQSPGLTQLWAGTATLGFAGTAGNARTLTFTTGVNAARVTRTDKTSLYFNIIKASALVNGKNADTAQAVRGGIAYDHNVSSRLFVNVFNDYEYDKFQNLDLRFVLGGGFGFHAIKTDRSTLDVLGGIDYNRSKFSHSARAELGRILLGRRVQSETHRRHLARAELPHVRQSLGRRRLSHKLRYRRVHQAGQMAHLERVVENNTNEPVDDIKKKKTLPASSVESRCYTASARAVSHNGGNGLFV